MEEPHAICALILNDINVCNSLLQFVFLQTPEDVHNRLEKGRSNEA